MWRRLIGLLSASAMLLAPPADAMRYKLVRTNPNVVLIIAQGEIAVNENAAFKAALQDVPPGTPMIGLVVNSGGGNVLAAEEMAALIHTGGISIAVTSGAVCASACFLLFAASPHRFAALGALIGVHSVSAATGENEATWAATTLFARDASDYGVPPEILGRLVATPPGQIAWLTRAELAAMHVTFLTAQPQPQPDVSTAASAAPAPTGSPLFRRGLADRTAWEAWFASLTGALRAGADYWAGQRSLPRPGSCRVMAIRSPDPDGFAAGCVEARRFLARSDQRRRDPDYSAGWNSF